MLSDDVVVRFNESLRGFSMSVKELTDAGHNISFEFKKNKLIIMRDGNTINTLYVDNPEKAV